MKDFLFETTHWKIVLHENQAYFGRLVIICRAERNALGELSQDEQLEFFKLVKHLEDFFRNEFNATMFNYSCLMNNAYRDNEKPRVHWHFRPRYKEPITVLGEQLSDPNFGYHYASEAFGLNGRIPDNVRAHLAEKITESLSRI